MTDIVTMQRMYSHNNFQQIANKWSELLDIPITPVQVVLMFLELKMVHMKSNPDHYENLMNDKRYLSALEDIFFGDKFV